MKAVLQKKVEDYENFFEALLIPCIALFSLVAFVIFRHEVSIELIGDKSLGIVMLVTGIILCVTLFPIFYLIGLRLADTPITKKTKFFNTITLTIAMCLLITMMTALIIALLNFITKDLRLDRFIAAAIVGVYAAAVGYGIIPTALRMNTTKIVRIFSLVVLAGVILSMVTAGDNQWWQINFSALGTSSTPKLASSTFNVTLIISGLLLISLTSHLTKDIKKIPPHTKGRLDRRYFLESNLVLMGAAMASIGAFPYDRFPRLHDTFAYFMVATFILLVSLLAYYLPKISRVFLLNSYFSLAVVIFLYVLFMRYDYISLTAFELLAFLITLGWLVMFANRVSKSNTAVAR